MRFFLQPRKELFLGIRIIGISLEESESELDLHLGEERILSDRSYHDWMTELCHGGSLSLSMPWKNSNATALAKLLARSSVPITQKRDIFNWHGYLSVSIPLFQSDGRSYLLTCHWAISFLWQCRSKRKIRAMSRGTEFTISMESSSLLVNHFWWRKAIGKRKVRE